jgi:hypothetical protein
MDKIGAIKNDRWILFIEKFHGFLEDIKSKIEGFEL